MSIALNARIKELERQVEDLERLLSIYRDELAAMNTTFERQQQRIEALENRPKPGRPPKNA